MIQLKHSPDTLHCHICAARDHEPFLDHPEFRIRRCTACGVRFLFPQPSPDDLLAYYDDGYFRSDDSPARGYEAYVADADNHRATFRNRLRMMPSPTGDARLVDVGAATGFFVEQARLNGWQAVGVEPSQWAATYAQNELKQPVFHGTLEDVGYPDDSVDAMTLWEVIEHLADPRAFLAEAARVIRPGGFLALSTPDAGSFPAKFLGRRWPGWAKVPEHLFFFDKESLTRLLTGAGFRVESTRYVSITVTAGFAAKRLASVLGTPWIARLPAKVASKSLPLNPLYDMMLIARRA